MFESTLLFITDISGFTSFVAAADPEKGRDQAQRLLSCIVEANTIGLELCEVEGDAVFFYLRGEMPSWNEVQRQIHLMHSRFHACLSSMGLDGQLGIKFFVHAGNCDIIEVAGRRKLFGLDVIKIHRLLKGIEAGLDYAVLTSDAAVLLSAQPVVADDRAADFYKHLGYIQYLIYSETSIVRQFGNISPEHVAQPAITTDHPGVYSKSSISERPLRVVRFAG